MVEIYSHCPLGYEGFLIKVEADLRRGLPGMDIVGLPDNAVKESRERIRIAFRRSGFEFPHGRILINLAPAGIKKLGARYDLAIALALLQVSGQIQLKNNAYLVLGELELSGRIRRVNGVLGALNAFRSLGPYSVVPAENLLEAWPLRTDFLIAGHSLRNTVDSLEREEYTGPPAGLLPAGGNSSVASLEDIKGQSEVKRVLEIAAAGGHHLFLYGPPGGGKTLSARTLVDLLPPLEAKQQLEVSQIYSLSPQMGDFPRLNRVPPFREPHHSSSREGLLGGGKEVYPGEVSLAHQGILLLDEAPEFKSDLLQGLREPLERGQVTLARAGSKYTYPAEFQLVLTANPCPCGNLGKLAGRCFCNSREIDRYWKKMGGALLDRIDLRLPVKPPKEEDLLAPTIVGEGARAASRVEAARRRQILRNKGILNARLGVREIQEYIRLTPKVEELFFKAVKKLGLSARAVHSVLKVGRTIADIKGNPSLEIEELYEAIQYRRFGNGIEAWPLD